MSEPAYTLMLRGGPRDGQVIGMNTRCAEVACPVLSADRRWCSCAYYDGETGEFLRSSAPRPQAQAVLPTQPLTTPRPALVSRVRRALGLRIAGLTEDDIGGDW